MTEQRRRAIVVRVMIVSPLIVATFVLLGVYLGFYVSDLTGLSKGILGILAATAGFFLSLPIIVKMVNRIVAQERKEPNAAETAS